MLKIKPKLTEPSSDIKIKKIDPKVSLKNIYEYVTNCGGIEIFNFDEINEAYEFGYALRNLVQKEENSKSIYEFERLIIDVSNTTVRVRIKSETSDEKGNV